MLLSASRLSLGAQFEHQRFFTPYSKLFVQGSWIRHAYWTLHTARGRLLKVDFSAHEPTFNGSRHPKTVSIDDVTVRFDGHEMVIVAAGWRTRAKATRGAPHWGLPRLDIVVQPLYNVARSAIAPHGLLGQTYDGDGVPTHGARDSYERLDDGTPTRSRKGTGGVITTRAKGEGGIEGTAEMYRVRKPFDTDFAFSRFGSERPARPRVMPHKL